MIEIVSGSNRLVLVDLEFGVRASLRQLRDAVAERGQITWGEHCSECSHPSCYSSCSHYTPRADLHCRRFEHGIESARVTSLTDTLMRIRFRKWGKLGGEGPVPLRPQESVRRHERTRSLVGEVSDWRVLPHGLRHGAGRLWTMVEAALAEQSSAARADAFVVECVSSGERGVPFTLTIMPKERSKVALFQERLSFGPSYTRAVVPVDRIARQVDLNEPFFVQIEPLVEAPPETFLFGVVDFVRWKGVPAAAVASSAAASKRKPAARAKCIVWDLDDTLWDGTLAEAGVEGVKLRSQVVDVIRALDARGILHSIASKNDEKNALAALARFGIDELFLHPQVGWGPKSESVRRIARLMNIGLDAFVFVDDQPFERSEVQETLGCVTAFPDTEVQGLLTHELFDVPVTAESPRRRLMYREEMRRNMACVTVGASEYDGFLRSSDIRLDLTLLTPEAVTRIYDLSQRTNQVNVSGTRYERRVVEDMARAPGAKLPIVMRCEDRFGDYGIIGFVLLDPDAGVVEDYFMSCRVQRKLVENALFAHIVKVVAARGAPRLRCRYKRTERNELALTLLCDIGFQLMEMEPGVGWLEHGMNPIPSSDIVRVSADLGDVRTLEAAE